MMYAAKLAVQLGLAEQGLVDRQTKLLESLGLPTKYSGNATIKDIMFNIAKDKKNTSIGTSRLVLPKLAGHMIVQQIDNETIENTISNFLTT
jgi:3-dehydroquinate synthetase